MCRFSVDIGHALKVICCCREMQKLHHGLPPCMYYSVCSDTVLALPSSKRLQAVSIVTIIIRQLSSPPTPTIQETNGDTRWDVSHGHVQ